jgi:hypothetical protein
MIGIQIDNFYITLRGITVAFTQDFIEMKTLKWRGLLVVWVQKSDWIKEYQKTCMVKTKWNKINNGELLLSN